MFDDFVVCYIMVVVLVMWNYKGYIIVELLFNG